MLADVKYVDSSCAAVNVQLHAKLQHCSATKLLGLPANQKTHQKLRTNDAICCSTQDRCQVTQRQDGTGASSSSRFCMSTCSLWRMHCTREVRMRSCYKRSREFTTRCGIHRMRLPAADELHASDSS
jgi:hypothetical protein